MIPSLENIQNGTIIRFKSDKIRDWVCIHHTSCIDEPTERLRKHVKDHTGFYLFGGLWYDGDPFTDQPYGKSLGMLKIGMFNDLEIVGSLTKTQDYLNLKSFDKV